VRTLLEPASNLVNIYVYYNNYPAFFVQLHALPTTVLEEKHIHHESHMELPGIEPGVLLTQANCLNLEA
jgi:hypothetical protein